MTTLRFLIGVVVLIGVQWQLVDHFTPVKWSWPHHGTTAMVIAVGAMLLGTSKAND